MKKTFTFLIAMAALMLVGMSANAQGGQNPFVGSTHDYTVTPGNVANDLDWLVDGATTGSGFLINSGQDEATVNITWTAPGTYVLTLTETDVNSCATTVEMTVTVTSTFEVSTTDPVAVCNTANDTANAANNNTIVDIVVSMNTGVAAWSPNWEVTFDVAGVAGSPTISSVTSGDGTLNDNGGGSYTLTGITSTAGAGTATISVEVTGDAFTLLTATLTITAAQELQYNTTDTDSGDWGATATINPIPNTSAITTD